MNESTPRPRHRLRRYALEFAIFLVVFSGISVWQTSTLPSGTPPPLAGELLDGSHFDASALRGRPALIHFWATWCPVCRHEAGNVAAVAADHPTVTVAMRSGGAAEVRRFLADHGGDYRVLLDDDGVLSERFGVRAVPATLILDREGRVRFKTVGYTTEIGLRLRLWLADKLG